MRLNGRRESSNVEDSRGMSGGAKAGLGIGGVIVVALMTLLGGGDISSVIQSVFGAMQQQPAAQTQKHTPSAEEEQWATFSKQVLASTEDVWTEQFKKKGWTYECPTMKLFTGAVQTACGGATSDVGPFYCSGDQKVYLDLSFFNTMKTQLSSGGDFAYAYVIAHEVGHHVEYSTGLLNKVHEQMSRVSKAEANKLSVRLELLADYYAGVWAHYENEKYKSLEAGDVEEAINCAQHIGDDYLQKRATGQVVPENFTHGTSAQRLKWFMKGYETGSFTEAPTFEVSENQL